MSVRRLEGIPGFNIDRVAAAAGDDPDVLRMENLDTDIPPRLSRGPRRSTPSAARLNLDRASDQNEPR